MLNLIKEDNISFFVHQKFQIFNKKIYDMNLYESYYYINNWTS